MVAFLFESVTRLYPGCEFPTCPHEADDSMDVEPADSAICMSTYPMTRSISFGAPLQLVNDTSRRQCKKKI